MQQTFTCKAYMNEAQRTNCYAWELHKAKRMQ